MEKEINAYNSGIGKRLWKLGPLKLLYRWMKSEERRLALKIPISTLASLFSACVDSGAVKGVS